MQVSVIEFVWYIFHQSSVLSEYHLLLLYMAPFYNGSTDYFFDLHVLTTKFVCSDVFVSLTSHKLLGRKIKKNVLKNILLYNDIPVPRTDSKFFFWTERVANCKHIEQIV